VQFDGDRQLAFFNQPFAIMAQLEPEWLTERPEFDRVLERMRENGRLPEVRDFPAWKAERRDWFTSAEETIEEDWMLANGDHLRLLAQPLPDGGLRLIFEDRTEQVRLASARDTLLRVRAATFDNLFEVISVFASDGRLYLWNRRFSELWDLDEGWLAEHPRVDELVPAMAKRLVNPTAAAQVRESELSRARDKLQEAEKADTAKDYDLTRRRANEAAADAELASALARSRQVEQAANEQAQSIEALRDQIRQQGASNRPND